MFFVENYNLFSFHWRTGCMDWAWCGAASRWQSSRSVGGVVYSEAVNQCADTSDTEHALLCSVSDGHCQLHRSWLRVSVGKCDNNVLMFIVSAPCLINHNKQFISPRVCACCLACSPDCMKCGDVVNRALELATNLREVFTITEKVHPYKKFLLVESANPLSIVS